jgi:iron complex transport system ATP-binding protein
MPWHAGYTDCRYNATISDCENARRTNSAVVIEIVNFSYRQDKILRNIGFREARGQICGLPGPNSSGKTTLLECTNGILKPDTGNIRTCNRKPEHLSREEIAGWIAA